MSSKIIKPEPLYIQAYNQLKEDIIDGKLAPGKRLTDQQLAEWLGISRTPVREATRMLCKEGLLFNENGVITVYKPTLEDIIQVYLLRASIESLAAANIAVMENKNQIVKILNDIVEKSTEAFNKEDLKMVQTLNTVFHNSLIKYSNLVVLEEAYLSIDAKMKMFRSISLKNLYNRKISIEEHKQIIKHIKNGQVLECKAVAEKHILNAGKRRLQEFSKTEKLEDCEILRQAYKYIDAHLQ